MSNEKKREALEQQDRWRLCSLMVLFSEGGILTVAKEVEERYAGG